MRYVTVRLWRAALVGAVLALVAGLALSKCDTGRPGSPFTQTARVVPSTLAPNSCTRAYGQCEVTEFIHVRRDGTHWVETCFAAPPIRPGASNVWIAVNYCYHP